MSSGGKKDTTGLYYLDRFGNLELLYRDSKLAAMYPIPLARGRSRPSSRPRAMRASPTRASS